MSKVFLRRQVGVSATLCAIIISFLGCVSARAGVYVIHNCPASEQPNFDAGPWHATSSAPLVSVGGFQASCTPGSNPLGTAIGWYANEQALNTDLGVELTTPSDEITVRKVRLIWSVAHSASGSDTFAQVLTGSNSELIASTPYVTTSSGPAEVYFPDGTHEIFVGDYCSYDASSNCGFLSNASPVIRLEGMDTTLEDSSSPSAMNYSGSLAGSGPLSGKATLQFTATDSASGVRETELLLDGSSVNVHSYASQCPYMDYAACPQAMVDSFSIDTDGLPEGEHRIALRVISASGNSQIVDDHSILVSNGGSSQSQSQGGEINPPPCTSASNTHVALAVRATSHELVSNYHQQKVLDGLLTSRHSPLANATIEVLARPATNGGSLSLVSRTTTNAHGRFQVHLQAPQSRSICLRYKPLSGGLYAATIALNQGVRAPLRLKVNRRWVTSNGTVHLQGQVLGGFVPQLGKVVELQVYYLGGWRVFRTPRTDADGYFKSFYSFLGGRGTFNFRACVRAEDGYPFIFGCSNVVAIRAG